MKKGKFFSNEDIVAYGKLRSIGKTKEETIGILQTTKKIRSIIKNPKMKSWGDLK